MVTNKIRPYKSDTYHRSESCYAVDIAQMSILDIESGGFHGLKARLDFPAFFIRRDSEFRFVKADENLQFRNTVGVLDSTSSQINILSLHKEKFGIELLLSDLEVMEEPPGATWSGCLGIPDPEVLSDTDVVTNSHIVEKLDPLLADELSVGDKRVDTFISEEPYETQHDVSAFLPVGIAPFVKELENQRECDTPICDSEHEDVDVDLAEFPVGTIHRQYQTGLVGKQGKYDFGYDIKIKGELGDEPLDTTQIRIFVTAVGHCRCKFVKADGLHHAKGMKHKCHQLYSCQIHCFSKMLLHNRKDLVNFDQVLGISSFHGEKRSNFSFKLLIFRDFCKYNRLKFRCLTA